MASTDMKDESNPTSLSSSSNEQADDHTEDHTIEYPTGPRLVIILVGVIAACLLTGLDIAVIGTAIPSITNRFHSTPDIGWYGAAYVLAVCSLQPLTGKIFSVSPIKSTFLIFIFVFQFGSLLCATAINSNMFIFGRAVAGSGAAGIFTGGLAILRTIAPLRKSSFYTSIVFAMFGVATICGPIIGGALTQHASWRWCFYINLPVGAVTLIALVLFFHPPEPSKSAKADLNLPAGKKLQKLDLIGCTFFIGSVVMLLLALEWGGNKFAWRSATIIGLFVGFVVVLAIFLIWEHRQGDKAMIPFSLLSNRTVMASCVFAYTLMGSFIMCSYYLPEWFQIIKNATPQHSGVLMLPGVVAQALAAIASGIIVSRTGFFNQFLLIGPTFLAIAVGMYTTFTPHTPSSMYIPFQVLQGLGIGLSLQTPLVAVSAELDENPQMLQVAMSLVMFFNYFGSSTLLSAALTVFQNGVIKNLKHAGFDSKTVGMLLNAGATGARRVVEKEMPEKLDVVLLAYNDALTRVFYISVAGLIVCFTAGATVPWRNIKKTPAKVAVAAVTDEEAQK